MSIKKVGDWKALEEFFKEAPKRFQEAMDKAVLQEAQFFRTKIVEGIREQAPGGQAFKPLSPATLAVRKFLGFKGEKALLVRGDLRNSISVVREGSKVFVGVLRTAKTKAGQPLVNVAEVHEYGSRPIVIRLTPKARRFLHAAFRKAGLERPAGGKPSIGIAVIQVPARPFLRPVMDRWGRPEDAAKSFVERVAKLIGV